MTDRVCNCSQCGEEIHLHGDQKVHRIHDRPWCNTCIRVNQPSEKWISPVESKDESYHGGRFNHGEW